MLAEDSRLEADVHVDSGEHVVREEVTVAGGLQGREEIWLVVDEKDGDKAAQRERCGAKNPNEEQASTIAPKD